MVSNHNSEKAGGRNRPGPKVQSGLEWSASPLEDLLKEKTKFRIIAIERECACGAASISKKLSHTLNWKLWDQLLAQELAASIRNDLATEKRHVHRTDERFRRVAQVFWRGSYERSAEFGDYQCMDPAHMVATMQKVIDKIAREGNAVVVGRGAPGFFRDRDDTFHVFLANERLERAADLLRCTDMRVKEITYSVGYGQEPSFTRAFKKRFDISPAIYRRQQRLFSKEIRFG